MQLQCSRPAVLADLLFVQEACYQQRRSSHEALLANARDQEKTLKASSWQVLEVIIRKTSQQPRSSLRHCCVCSVYSRPSAIATSKEQSTSARSRACAL